MENDNAVIVAGIFLGVCLAVLLIIKIVSFFMEFNDVVRYITGEMRRAGDDDEYRYWRRELRCHYLCLIPFVTERNVMRVYKKVFYKPKHKTPVKRTDGIYHVLAPSVIGIFICAVCLCGASWAWFTSTTSAGMNTIRSATFQISEVQIIGNNDSTVSPGEDGKYTLAQGTYTLSFQAAEANTSSKGYCCITVYKEDETAETYYYTNNLGNGTYTVTVVNNENKIAIKIEPFWGDVANKGTDETIASEGSITVGTAVQNYVIVKNALWNNLKNQAMNLSRYPQSLKFVTGDVVSQYTYATETLCEDGKHRIRFSWDADTKTMYIGPNDATDSTSVVCAPADSSYLFYNANNYMMVGNTLTEIDCSNLDTSKVTNMSGMFSGFSKLTNLTLGPRFNTSKVTNMSDMFLNCSKLTTITVKNSFNTDNVISGYDTNMFAGCTSLVGGAGTMFDGSKVDKSYAKIDGGSDDPGYFTGANN